MCDNVTEDESGPCDMCGRTRALAYDSVDCLLLCPTCWDAHMGSEERMRRDGAWERGADRWE